MLFVEDDTTPDDARDAQLGSLASKLKEVPRDFPFVTKLFMVLIPVLLAIGYLTYAQVRGGVTISTTPPTTPRLEQGLVGHWTFDGGDMISSTTVRDLSSSNATGTLVNNPQKVAGRLGQGLLFDGVDEYVSIGNKNIIDGATEASVCFWMKYNPPSVTADSAIVSKYGATQGWLFWVDDVAFYSGRTNTVSFAVDTNLSGPGRVEGATDMLVPGEWAHYCGTFKGGQFIQMYRNAELRAENTTSIPAAVASNAEPIYIANSAHPTNIKYMYANIDEVRIYDRALSADEIRELYDIGTPTKLNSGISQQQGAGNLDSGLAGYWKLDDVSGTSAVDSSTNASTGTLSGTPTWGAGQIKGGIDFDGSDDSIEIGSSLKVSNASQGTVSAWVRFDGWSSIDGFYNTIFAYGGGGALNAGRFLFQQRYFTDTHYLSIEQSSDGETRDIIRGGTALSLSTWYHVVVVSDGSTYRLYLNGAPETLIVYSGSNTGDWFGDTVVTETDRTIIGGIWQNGAGPSSRMNGMLDEVRMYNRALSADEVSALYRLTVPTDVDTGLKGYWSFNGPDMSGTTAYDRSGAGNNATIVNGPTKVIGKVGQGLSFDGGDDYASIKSSELISATSALTISAWVKTSFSSDNQNIYTENNSANGHLMHQVTILNTGRVVYDTYTPSGGSLTGTIGVNDGVWHHIVVARLTDNTTSIFIDGVLDVTGAVTDYDGGLAVSAVFIGRRHNTITPTQDDYFNGSLDEIRVYNRALSIDEITNLYHAGRGVTINAFTCGTDTVYDRDSNVYNTISIGTQCWMQQNMRVGTRVSDATTQTDNDTIEKYCYSNSDANCTSNNPNYPDGGLYQWDEAMQYSTTEGSQGICPIGWHIPTHDEFTTLERTICTSGSCATDFPYDTTTTGYRGTDEGTKLKPNGTSGFEANHAGGFYLSVFMARAVNGIFWSSSESDASAWLRFVNSSDVQVYRLADNKLFSYSVRCLKN